MRLHELEDLPMDPASRMQRAKDMGFTVAAYHGTKAKFNEFDLEKGQPSVMGGYAPHFADDKSESRGYAGRKGQVLHVLLRVRKPFLIDFGSMDGIPPETYQTLFGEKPKTESDLRGSNVMGRLEGEIGWEDRRNTWTHVYKRLKAAGFDALVYRNVFTDHSRKGKYTKFVVLDPKNVRSVDAAFDPSKSDSADLMA